MKYDHYSVEDFVLDADFRAWVLYPDIANRSSWQRWIEENPEKITLIEEARNIVLSAEYDEVDVDTHRDDLAWEVLRSKIQDHESRPTYDETRAAIPRRSILYRAAAVLTGLLVLSGTYYWYSNAVTRQYASNYGELKTVSLPDGSFVTLNANSTLSYRCDFFTGNVRKVSLKGEAYFTVRKSFDHGVPQKFVVDAHNISIEVLGTQFNVNDRHGKAWVVLTTGAIQLTNHQVTGDPVRIHPGEFAEYSEDDRRFKIRKVNTRLYTSWRKSQLVFDGDTVREILLSLEEQYGYRFTVKDARILDRKFKGAFPSNRPDILLNALEESLHLKITKAKNDIIMENRE